VSQAAVDRARAGEAEAFEELTAPHIRELQLHCYRMLGSLNDAEDVVQETLLAAWRGLEGFSGRASFRTWLYRIATNRCLNFLRDARRRQAEPMPPFEPPEPTSRAEVTWLQPYPDALLPQVADREGSPEGSYEAREAVELAFIVGLQQLPPRQAATLVLHDVLGFTRPEVAAMLDTTPTAVKGALQRARAALDERSAEPKSDQTPGPGSVTERELARRFAEAFTDDEVDRVIALLTDDAWLTMPPAPHQYRGLNAIAAFLRARASWRAPSRFTLVPTHANTQPAFGCYLTEQDESVARPTGLIVIALRAERVSAITYFLDGELPPRFGLPDQVRV
jgi:RNA polymerase sigma-70 factor (TIGR02960 family)